MHSQRLAISGLGAVTGYGWGLDRLRTGLFSGVPAAVQHDGYGRDRDEKAWASVVPEGGDPADGPSRFIRAMRAAVREAIADARERGWREGRRVGLVHAAVLYDPPNWRDFHVRDGEQRSVRDYLGLMPSTSLSLLMKEFGFHGPAMNVGAMCASGNAGLLTAKAWLDAGIVDDVVFVATDLSAQPEHLLHFRELGVAVTDTPPLEACRPFQKGSLGYTMAEASVGAVLSRSVDRPYAHLLGGAMTHDAHHVTSINPDLEHIDRCFREALDNAGVDASDVRYLNAHGPGTQQCDRAEAAIADGLFGPETALYSVKPLVGHCQGAASAVELAAAAFGYETGTVPAPPRVAPGHERLLDGPHPTADGITVKSSIGMGGHNSAVVLAPPQ